MKTQNIYYAPHTEVVKLETLAMTMQMVSGGGSVKLDTSTEPIPSPEVR